MARKLLILWLLGGVFVGYGSALLELAHGGGPTCHRSVTPPEAP
jgi:hypothetical protein